LETVMGATVAWAEANPASSGRRVPVRPLSSKAAMINRSG
jgi:hypothetical protein